MGIQSQFNKFEKKIRLTWQDDRLKKIREKDESIKSDIRKAFKENGYSVQDFFNQGSYATKTSIVPLDSDYDIDVGVVIKKNEAPENPVLVKKTLKEVLVKRSFKNPMIKKPCVTAQYFKSGDPHFHLDYPIYSVDEYNNYKLAVGKENSDESNRSWDDCDPKGLIDWLNDLNHFEDDQQYAQYKRSVKYLKRWRDFCFRETQSNKVYSIGIMIMVRESFMSVISNDGDVSDLESLKYTVDKILSKSYFTFTGYDANHDKQYDLQVILPVSPHRDVFTKHGKSMGTLIHKKFEKLSGNLEKAIKEVCVKKQSQILNEKVFGSDFPIPEDDDSENRKFKESGFVSSPQGAK